MKPLFGRKFEFLLAQAAFLVIYSERIANDRNEIDIDPQFNATQCLMSPPEYIEHLKKQNDTILNIFDRPKRTTASTIGGFKETESKGLHDIKPVKVSDNYWLLPGNLELYRIEMSPGEGRENRLNKYLKVAKEKKLYDYVLIDTPPTPSIWMTSALLASDYYLIPVKADPISFTGIDLLQGIIDDKKENFGLNLECAGVVLTMVEETTLVYQEAVQFLSTSKWGKQKFTKELPKRTVIARKQMSKSFILDLDDNAPKTAITGIVDELLNRIN